MKRISLTSVAAVGLISSVNIFSISQASAAVTFLELTANAEGLASIYTGAGPVRTAATPADAASTTDLTVATTTGVTSAPPQASRSSGSGRRRVAASVIAETVSAKALSATDVTMTLSGSTQASVGSRASTSAYATAGDNGSSGSYEFSSTTGATVTITANTTSSGAAAGSYVVDLYDVTTSTDYASFSVDANADLEQAYVVPGGIWKVSITESTGASAADYVLASGRGSSASSAAVGSFELVVSVPEVSTWAMAALGFAGLGCFGRRGARSSVSLV